MSTQQAKTNTGAGGLPEWLALAAKSQALSLDYACNQMAQASADPFNLAGASSAWLHDVFGEPERIMGIAGDYWLKNAHLQVNFWQRLYGIESEPLAEPAAGDRRFGDDAWTEIPWFDYLKQSYLLFTDMVEDCIGDATVLDEQESAKLKFFAEQWVHAVAPTNFALTNPAVLREAIRTNGGSLLDGYKNFLRDWERSDGGLRVSLSDPDAFELGRNIATTPGKVMFQNELIQLIQYDATTKAVTREPLLVIPPWINKYYVMDLRPENSILKWWVDQGHTVFVISWVNPDESYADKTFEDYMLSGVYAAVDAIEQRTGEDRINAVGYCIGGTLLAAILAHMAAVEDKRIKTATFLTTLIDFSDPGEIRAFIDEGQIENIEAHMDEKGYLDGTAMASAFSMLRANDLIWGAVINNYLLGKPTGAFDLLHWNADSTRMPRAMHSYYLRKMYLENRLCCPGGLELAGEALDIARVDVPVYFLSTAEDHIAPWRTTYAGARLFLGPVRYVLGGSGHIAGVINPPAKNKYDYMVDMRKPAAAGLDEDPDQWLAQATRRSGSWWPDWQQWLNGHCTEQVPARRAGSMKFPAIEDAPGSYVAKRID